MSGGPVAFNQPIYYTPTYRPVRQAPSVPQQKKQSLSKKRKPVYSRLGYSRNKFNRGIIFLYTLLLVLLPSLLLVTQFGTSQIGSASRNVLIAAIVTWVFFVLASWNLYSADQSGTTSNLSFAIPGVLLVVFLILVILAYFVVS